MANFKQIARQVGTSTATVSRVLGNSAYPVSAALKARVLAAAKALDYQPNLTGRQLKTQSVREIGVIVPTISNPFYARLFLGVELEARKQGYQVLLCDSFRDAATERAYIETLIQKQVAGLILSTINPESDYLAAIQRRGLQIVTMDQNVDSASCHRVGFDFFRAGFMAAEYLLDCGHRELSFLSTPLTRRSRREQLEGCQLALLKHNIQLPAERILIAEHESEQESVVYELTAGRLLAERFLALQPRPQAIIAVNDLLAISLIQALSAAGLSVPDDVSVIGFDNLELSEMITPGLTTLDQPALEMGQLACRILLGQIRQPGQPDLAAGMSATDWAAGQPVSLTLQPRLVIRRSVRRRDSG